MEILHEEINGKGAFFIKDDTGRVAELEYERENSGVIIATHTRVSPALEGQGIARKLFDKLIEHTRKEKTKILAVCPYVKKRLSEKIEEFKDIIDERNEFIK